MLILPYALAPWLGVFTFCSIDYAVGPCLTFCSLLSMILKAIGYLSWFDLIS